MRNKTIDAFRGLIMIIMALDHASYFVINTHFYEGYDFITTYPSTLAFLTRWVTHLCAPGFFFAMGYGAFYSFKKRKYKLLLRALILVILQFTLINLAWQNDIIYVGVITSLALSLAILTLMMPLMKKYGLIMGLLMIVISQSLIHSDLVSSNTLLVRLLLVPGLYKGSYILYTILPWLGVAMIGAYYAERKIPYLKLSLISFVIFILFTTEFDSLSHLFTIIKYPASIRFLSLTMGINFIVMGILHHQPIKFLIVYGKAPLEFYILHLYLYAGVGLLIQSSSYVVLYLSWFIGVLILYYPCYYIYKIKKNLFMQPYASK
jgi:uncharacterized membrane protein